MHIIYNCICILPLCYIQIYNSDEDHFRCLVKVALGGKSQNSSLFISKRTAALSSGEETVLLWRPKQDFCEPCMHPLPNITAWKNSTTCLNSVRTNNMVHTAGYNTRVWNSTCTNLTCENVSAQNVNNIRARGRRDRQLIGVTDLCLLEYNLLASLITLNITLFGKTKVFHLGLRRQWFLYRCIWQKNECENDC